MAPTRVIEVFADVACPFTHVGLRRFVVERNARGLQGVRLVMRAWPLEIVNGAPLGPDVVAREVADVRSQVAPDLFTGFDPSHFPATSIPAFGLAAAAYDARVEMGEAVSLALRDSLFERGRDVADRAVLAELGARFGVAPLTDEEAERRVRADLEEGRARGVVGSPYFFVEPSHGVFCPTLRIDQVGERLRVEWDADAFEALLASLDT